MTLLAESVYYALFVCEIITLIAWRRTGVIRQDAQYGIQTLLWILIGLSTIFGLIRLTLAGMLIQTYGIEPTFAVNSGIGLFVQSAFAYVVWSMGYDDWFKRQLKSLRKTRS